MSYSSLLSLVATADSSSLDALTAQFAHLPSRRTDAACFANGAFPSPSPLSPSATVSAALITHNHRFLDSSFAQSSGGEATISSSTPQANSSASNRSTSSYHHSADSIAVTELSSSEDILRDSTKAVSTSARFLPGVDVIEPPTAPWSSFDASSSSTATFTSNDERAALGGAAATDAADLQKNLFVPLDKFDAESCRVGNGGVAAVGVAAHAHAASTRASRGTGVHRATPRVETVEWHMLDKLKFYPMSTTCSFMIRGMLYPFTLIKTRIQV